MSPSTILKRVKEDVMLQELLRITEAGCKKPTFVPITVSVLQGKHFIDDYVDSTAFVAVHTLQILMFSPTDWAKDRSYSRDLDAYEHRCPTPSGFGGGEEAVIGPFSYEDFHRAVCLFWMAHTRTESPQRNVLGRIPGTMVANFQGYYDPDAWQSDLEEDNDSEARFTADQGIRLHSLHEEFLAAAERRASGPEPQELSTTPTQQSHASLATSQKIAGDELFELYAMAANAMDVQVARKANDANDLGANLRNDLPDMLNSDFETLFTALNKKFGQPDLAANAEITRKAINSFLSFLKNDEASQIMRINLLLRTLHLSNFLPDDTAASPAPKLPPMEVITEELRYDTVSAAMVKRHGDEMAAANIGQDGGRINFGAYREGMLGAYDVRNIRLLGRGADKLFGSNKALAASQLQQLRDGKFENIGGSVIAGVEYVKQLAAHSVHGGLDFFFCQTIMDPNVPTLIGPQQWLRWLLGGSPIMTRVLELCHEYIHKRRERVVVFCDTPWIQQITFATLEMAGFKVNTIRSSDNSTKRAQLVAEFTDSATDCQIFLANINILVTGVNLQACCNKGIMMSYHHNADILKQVYNILRRVGQTKTVTWHMLKVVDSFNDHQERLCMSNWAKQMSTEIVLEDWYPDNIREMIIYEFQRAYFGQPFNRYAWVLLQDWDPTTFSYNSDHTVKMGHAISCVAKMCVSAKGEESHLFWIQLSEDLALGLAKFVDRMSVEEVRRLTLKERGELVNEFLKKLMRDVQLAAAEVAVDEQLQVKKRRVRDEVEKRRSLVRVGHDEGEAHAIDS